jgi:hypothetical protein
MIQRTRAERDAAVENGVLQLKRQIREKAPEMLFAAGELTLIDEWITATDPTIDRPEAIRRLVELGLKVKGI